MQNAGSGSFILQATSISQAKLHKINISASLALNMATAIPHKNDVLFGRGHRIHKHHGNQQFRSMVDAQRPKFVQLIKNKEKRAVALKIMQDIFSLEPPGRFLVESKGVAPSTNSVNDSNENESGVNPTILSKMWVIVDNEKAIKKVLHRLRDKDPGGEDEIQPSAKKIVQKSRNMPDGNMPYKLSQNDGTGGAFAGGLQTKSAEDFVLQSSGRVNENCTTSGHKKNSDTNTRAVLDRRRVSSLSSDSHNKDATWEDITGEAMDRNASPTIYGDQDAGMIMSNSLRDECDWDELDSFQLNLFDDTTLDKYEGDALDMSDYSSTARSPEYNIFDERKPSPEDSSFSSEDRQPSPVPPFPQQTSGDANLNRAVECIGFHTASEAKRKIETQVSSGTAPPTVGDTKVGTSIPTSTDTGVVIKRLSFKGDEESIMMSSSFPINLTEWINRSIHSSVDDGKYLQNAVNLALVLTNHLLDLHNTSDNLRLNDLRSDNLIISVGPEVISLDGEDDADAQQNSLVVKRVKFISEDSLRMTVRGRKNIAVSYDGAVDSRLLCAPFGNILLEIFSKGQPNSMAATTNNDSMGSTQNGDNKSQEGIFDLLLARFQDEEEDSNGSTNNCTAANSTQNRSNESQDTIASLDDCEAEYEVAAKRMAAVSLASDSLYDQAKRLLVDMGAPLSICQLICDLLDTVNDKPSSNSTSHITLEEALWDLSKIKNNPQMFLFDRTCPERALDDTHLFDSTDGQIFGRKEEIGVLMNIKNNISQHIIGDPQDVNGSTQSTPGRSFLFEAAFLAGYAGSGKSCLMRSLIKKCEKDKWFVLKCKFDSKSVPLRVIAKAFDDFFGALNPTSEDSSYQHDQSMLESFHQVSQAICSAFDGDSFSQLCAMIPNMSRIFPLGSASGSVQGLSSEGAAGAAEKRIVYLINSLLQALCSSGRPVLLALDNLQWSDSIVMAGLSSFDVIHMNGESSVRRGLMIAGTYRSNGVKEGGDVLGTIDLIKNSDKANLAMLNVHGLSEGDINQLISAKLGLPWRYTLDLAKLVHRKTKGNPFFVIQFLKTIIHNKMLEFSVRQRMWTWDCDTIDLQMISEGVAELLTSTFDRLPAKLTQTLKIISLFGNQIEVLTVDQMNSGQTVLSFDMKPELDLAVKEGLLEKAGPLYAFAHDLIHQTLYDGMPAGTRRLLHKEVGKSLLESKYDTNHSMHLLAVDQINVYCKDDQLSHEERSDYARANAVAAHYAMAGSSFEKAQSYVDMGIKLLQPGHWEKQYSLSLDLYEVSASLCYMCGDTTKMSSCLNEILAHVNVFEDSLNASAMFARLLSSLSRHREAISNCLNILAKLGEEFPPQPDLAIVQNKLSETQQLLLTLTADKMKALPTMTDTSKLQAMKFLGMLCEISLMAAPMLLPLLSVRMMELTFQFGFCSDSILGISYTAYSMFVFTDDVPLAYRVGKVGVTLREESQHKHFLRSRLFAAWEGNMKLMIEPLQAVTAQFPSIFKSAMLVGDVQNAMFCRCFHCIGGLFSGEDLTAVSNHFALCIQQSVKFQQHVFLNMAMAWYRVLVQLSGQDDTGVKSFDELYRIGKESNNTLLLFNVIVSQLCVHFWFKDYTAIMKLCEKHPAPDAKRTLTTMRCFYEGIAALNLSRQQTNEPKYRLLGEEAVKGMSKFEQMNKWTFENKSLLLKAELHFLNQDYEAAENAYIASIKSAKAHKFMNEEAMANELFGIFCIENQMSDKGMKHLCIALDLYKQWGAMIKAADLEQFIKDKTKIKS